MIFPFIITPQRKWDLFRAASDFFVLLSGSYPRAAALELVGNRFALTAPERQVLRRGVFGAAEALSRRGKRIRSLQWCDSLLVVDGHNVHITIESHVEGRLLLKANDGAMRDIAGLSSRFRLSEITLAAVDLVFRFLEDFSPGEVLFLFDAPMSRSGELASIYRERMGKAGIRGEARTAPVPENEFPFPECIAASSDQAILDACERWVDLACLVVEYFGWPEISADFSALTSFQSAREFSPRGGLFWL